MLDKQLEIPGMPRPDPPKHGCSFCDFTGIVLNQWDNTEDCPVCHNEPRRKTTITDLEKRVLRLELEVFLLKIGDKNLE